MISKAIQSIKFELDNKGGSIKSEAAIEMRQGAMFEEDNKIRTFYIDNEFAIFLIEKDKNVPYFAAKIADISKVQ